jgi:hypothetical protein
VAVTGVAAAAAPNTVTATLTPKAVKKQSTLHVTAQGPFSGVSGLPQTLVIDVQKGFASSVKAVKTLCTSQQEGSNSCPNSSRIGQGNASVSVLGATSQVLLTLFLGKPQHNGDIATIDVLAQSQVLNARQSVTGRLLPHNGGLEIRFDQLPTFAAQIPAGITPTLNSLYISAGASRTLTVTTGKGKNKKKKVKYALITNPSTCSGSWVGNLVLTFASGTVSRTLAIPCSKH